MTVVYWTKPEKRATPRARGRTQAVRWRPGCTSAETPRAACAGRLSRRTRRSWQSRRTGTN